MCDSFSSFKDPYTAQLALSFSDAVIFTADCFSVAIPRIRNREYFVPLGRALKQVEILSSEYQSLFVWVRKKQTLNKKVIIALFPLLRLLTLNVKRLKKRQIFIQVCSYEVLLGTLCMLGDVCIHNIPTSDYNVCIFFHSKINEPRLIF